MKKLREAPLHSFLHLTLAEKNENLTTSPISSQLLIMGVSVKEITEQALTLSATEREKLASSLLQSTHNSELTEIDRQWISVAEERFADLQSGKDSGIPESEFFGKVKERIQWK